MGIKPLTRLQVGFSYFKEYKFRHNFKDACPPTSISKPKKVQQFQFQTSGILLFRVVQKFDGPGIWWTWNLTIFTAYATNFWQLRQLFIFCNYIGEIDHFTLDLLERSDTYHWTFSRVSYCVPSERRPPWTRV